VSGAVRARDTASIARHLQPFADDSTVSSITVTDSEGNALYRWKRPTPHPGALQFEATEPVREMVESIPGVKTPKTFGQLTITVEQVFPVAATTLRGRLAAADADQVLLGLILAGVLAVVAGLLGAGLAWRAGRKLEQPIAALIKGADRIGQGDYTRRWMSAGGTSWVSCSRPSSGCGAGFDSRQSTRTTCTACSTA